MPLRAIVLVGLRGVGKTTIGRALTDILGWSFVDSDEALAVLVGKPAGDWLTEVGEAAFREREEAVLLPLLASARDTVIATGGGVVTIKAVRQSLVHGDLFPVWLDAPTPVLIERSKRAPGSRPPLTELLPGAEWEHLRELRKPFYAEVSSLVIDTSLAEPATCAQAIVQAYRQSLRS